MSLNLGLESLLVESNEDVNDIEAVMNLYDITDVLSEESHYFNELIVIYSNLSTITDTVKKYGVSESLFDLIGDNFKNKSTISLEAEEAKKNIFRRILEAIKKFFTSLWTWFKVLFTSVNRAKNILKEIKRKALDFKYPFTYKPNIDLKYISEYASCIKDYARFIGEQKINHEMSEARKARFDKFFKEKLDRYENKHQNLIDRVARDVKIVAAINLIKECDKYIEGLDVIGATDKTWKDIEKKLSSVASSYYDPNDGVVKIEVDAVEDSELTKHLKVLSKMRSGFLRTTSKYIKGVYQLKNSCKMEKYDSKYNVINNNQNS